MFKKMATSFILIGLGIFLLYYLLPFIKEEKQARRLLILCQTLRIGMTVEEVSVIMGTPSRVKKIDYPNKKSDEGDEYYYFLSSRTASHPTKIEIKDEKIIRKICGGI